MNRYFTSQFFKTSCTEMVDVKLPWIEKYRPNKLDELVSHEDIIKCLRRMMTKGELPHLLLYGPPGTGKTSTILALAKEMGPTCSVLELNASDERGIEVIRSRIKDFVSSTSLFSVGKKGALKLLILDEADNLTLTAQMALRRVIEQFSKGTRFCLLGNYIHKLIPALQSRCTRFRFAPLADQHVVKRVKEIAQVEKVEMDQGGLNALLRVSHGDMRKVLNTFQATCMSSEKVTETTVYASTGYPLPSDMDALYHTLLTSRFSHNHAVLKKLLIDKGLALVDIVHALHERILVDSRLTPSSFRYLIPQLASIEYRLSIGASDHIQLTCLNSAFILARTLK